MSNGTIVDPIEGINKLRDDFRIAAADAHNASQAVKAIEEQYAEEYRTRKDANYLKRQLEEKLRETALQFYRDNPDTPPEVFDGVQIKYMGVVIPPMYPKDASISDQERTQRVKDWLSTNAPFALVINEDMLRSLVEQNAIPDDVTGALRNQPKVFLSSDLQNGR